MIEAYNRRHEIRAEEIERQRLRAEMLAERELNTSSKEISGYTQIYKALAQAQPDDDDSDSNDDNDNITDSESLNTSSEPSELTQEAILELQILNDNIAAADMKVNASTLQIEAQRREIDTREKRVEATKRALEADVKKAQASRLEAEVREMEVEAADLEMRGRKRKYLARIYKASAKRAKLELWWT